MKAYEISVEGFGDTLVIYSAETASKARYQTKLQLQDAGHDVDFGDIYLRRVPKYDHLATSQKRIGWTDGLDRHGCLVE